MASKEAWKKADVVSAGAGDVSAKLPQGKRRYVTAFLCLCVSTICYADRTNMGIALPAFVTNKKEQGEVLSAFFYGYMCTQIPGGYFAAKLGAKIVLLTGVIVWTLFDLSTVVVAKCLTCLFFTRAGMGLGEGILFPCMHQIAGAWYPVQERSRLVSLVASGSDLGTISALIISPAIMATAGWQRIFIVFGVLSFIWVVVYVFMGYFNQVLNLDLTKKGGFAAALPYMCGYTGTLLFGRIGDLLVTRGYRELHVRQAMNAFSFLGCAFFLFSLRLAKSAPMAVALLCMTLFTSRAAMAGYWVNMIDVAPNHAAHVMGVSNTFGTIPGIIGNVVTGAILQATGSWDLVFAIAALVLVFGAVFFHCYASDKSIYSRPSSGSNGEGYSSTSTTSSSFPGSPNYGLSLSSSIPELRDEEVGLLENPM
eukprot:jgi/Phyca11/17809/fgenesh1_pg.PHYCAscaffold_30_\